MNKRIKKKYYKKEEKRINSFLEKLLDEDQKCETTGKECTWFPPHGIPCSLCKELHKKTAELVIKSQIEKRW